MALPIYDRRASAGYIESVRASDVEITRDRNQVTARVEWTRRLHLVANASLLLEFAGVLEGTGFQ